MTHAGMGLHEHFYIERLMHRVFKKGAVLRVPCIDMFANWFAQHVVESVCFALHVVF